MQKIVQTGLTYFRDKVQAGETPQINKAVVCYVDGLDPNAEIDINATIPANIVDNDVSVTKGKMGDNTVACSAVFDSERGDYVYNWVGLVADTGELIAVATFPTQEKYKTNLPKIGNTFANNILLQFANAADIMDVTVDAASWQFDFGTELLVLKNRLLKHSSEMIGDVFIGTAFKVHDENDEDNQTNSVLYGVAYINGLRIETIGEAINLQPNKKVVLEVYPEANGMNGVHHISQIPNTDALPGDYQDAQGLRHVFVLLAETDAEMKITDHRKIGYKNGLASDIYHYYDELRAMTNYNRQDADRLIFKTDESHKYWNGLVRSASNLSEYSGLSGQWSGNEFTFTHNLYVDIGLTIYLEKGQSIIVTANYSGMDTPLIVVSGYTENTITVKTSLLKTDGSIEQTPLSFFYHLNIHPLGYIE